MTERVREAAESALVARVVLGTCAFLGLGLLGWGGSSLYSTSVGQQLLSQQVSTLVDTVAELKARIETSSADRYTGSSAASDRAAFLASFTAAIKVQSDSFSDLLQITNDRLQAISLRQTEFDRTLKELMEHKVRTEERQRAEDKQP